MVFSSLSAGGSSLAGGPGKGSVTDFLREEEESGAVEDSVATGSTMSGFACSTAGASTLGFSLMLFLNRMASGVMLRVFSGLLGGPFTLLFLPSSSLVANASGFSGEVGGSEVLRSCTMPASFSCCHCSFLASRLSLSSSLRSRFWGPSVMVRPRLPRVMFALRTSGATYFSCCALRKVPNLDKNSGCSWLSGLETGLERRVLRKSVVGLGEGSGLGVMLGFEVVSGGGMALSASGAFVETSGMSSTISGFDSVFTGLASPDSLGTSSCFSGSDSDFSSSGATTGELLSPRVTGSSTTSGLTGGLIAIVSSL